MEYEQLTTLIGSVGFPIAMCIALFYYMMQNNKQHQEETTALKDAITKLELAITKLCERFDNQ